MKKPVVTPINNSELSAMASSLGRKGGRRTFKRHGRKHYVKMANTRWGKKT